MSHVTCQVSGVIFFGGGQRVGAEEPGATQELEEAAAEEMDTSEERNQNEVPGRAEEQSTEQSLEGPELPDLHHVTQSATIPAAISRSKHRSWAQCGEVRRSWTQKAGTLGYLNNKCQVTTIL